MKKLLKIISDYVNETIHTGCFLRKYFSVQMMCSNMIQWLNVIQYNIWCLSWVWIGYFRDTPVYLWQIRKSTKKFHLIHHEWSLHIYSWKFYALKESSRREKKCSWIYYVYSQFKERHILPRPTASSTISTTQLRTWCDQVPGAPWCLHCDTLFVYNQLDIVA